MDFWVSVVGSPNFFMYNSEPESYHGCVHGATMDNTNNAASSPLRGCRERLSCRPHRKIQNFQKTQDLSKYFRAP